MLVVTKNRTKRVCVCGGGGGGGGDVWAGGKGSCAVCIDLQAVGALSSLVSYSASSLET